MPGEDTDSAEDLEPLESVKAISLADTLEMDKSEENECDVVKLIQEAKEYIPVSKEDLDLQELKNLILLACGFIAKVHY